jgi:hypothetical protein
MEPAHEVPVDMPPIFHYTVNVENVTTHAKDLISKPAALREFR